MNIFSEYAEKSIGFIKQIEEQEKDNIQKAAELVRDVIKRDGIVYTFGTGHSHLIAEEVMYRAGGLVPVYAIIEDGITGNHEVTKSEYTERLEGYAECILNYHKPTSNDCLIIISNSGRNGVTVEMAMEAKKRGIPTICITSVTYSMSQPSRHKSGKRLCELTDIVIDNCSVFGDACLKLEGLEQPVGPTSNFAATFIIHSVLVWAMELLLEDGVEVPVFWSGNMDGGREKNEYYLEKYWQRMRCW